MTFHLPSEAINVSLRSAQTSLQSILMVAAVIGRTKTAGYVSLVASFSMCAGFIYGSRIDDAVLQSITMTLGLFSFAVVASYFWSRARGTVTPQA